MFPTIIDFADMLLAALVVGAMFGVWLFFNPAGLAVNIYVTMHQQGVRTLNKPMPILGAATILLTIAAAVLGRNDSARAGLLVGASFCFVAVALITRFLNQPINSIVATWRIDSPPTNWTGLRDRWWRGHLIRLVTGVAGLCLLIAAMLRRG